MLVCCCFYSGFKYFPPQLPLPFLGAYPACCLLIGCQVSLSLCWTGFSEAIFADAGSSVKCWSGVLWGGPQLGIAWSAPCDRAGLRRETREARGPLRPSRRGCTLSIWVATGALGSATWLHALQQAGAVGDSTPRECRVHRQLGILPWRICPFSCLGWFLQVLV